MRNHCLSAILGSNGSTFRQVLLISEDKDDGVPHLAVVDDPVQLLPGLVYPVPVRTVHHEDKTLSASVVVAPQRSYLVLPADILQQNMQAHNR